MMVTLSHIVGILEEIEGDNSVPKSLRFKIASIKQILSKEGEVEVKKSKVLHQLEEIAEDTNLQQYTRTQIWDIISGLENIQ